MTAQNSFLKQILDQSICSWKVSDWLTLNQRDKGNISYQVTTPINLCSKTKMWLLILHLKIPSKRHLKHIGVLEKIQKNMIRSWSYYSGVICFKPISSVRIPPQMSPPFDHVRGFDLLHSQSVEAKMCTIFKVLIKFAKIRDGYSGHSLK